MSAVKNAVVQRFKSLCSERGIAANELANISGMTPSTVYSLFDEKRKNVSITTIKILCDGLEISLGDFYSTETPVLTVDEINGSEITFTSFLYGEQKKQTVRFGEELSEAVSSTFVIYDGINYSYVLTFSDKQL